MNRYFTYDTIHLWTQEAWKDTVSPLHALGRYLAYSGLADYAPHEHPEDASSCAEMRNADRRDGHGYIPSARIDAWEARGLHTYRSGAADPFFVMVPDSIAKSRERSPKVLHVIHCVDISNPWWSMDMYEDYAHYFEMALREGVVLIFTVASRADRIDLMVIMIREIAQRLNINYDQLYVDLSALKRAGRSLRDVPDFRYLDRSGAPVADPDGAIELFSELKIPALCMTGQWATRESLEFSNFAPGRIGSEIPFQLDRLRHSLVGRRMADAMDLEYRYLSADDAGVQAHLARLGLVSEYHETDNRGWLTVVPRSALDEPEKKIPCMMIMQEIVKADPHSILCAYSLWYEYLQIAAMGDLMLMFFALEEPDSNDMYMELLEEAARRHPFLDRRRVYMTGHSHNGHYTVEFMRRHPKALAGIATLGNPHGLSASVIDKARSIDDAVEVMSQIDMPTINIDGEWENYYSRPQLFHARGRRLDDAQRAEEIQRRLRASRCPAKTAQEILAARESPVLAVRKLGVPVDRAETVYFEGDECYVGDILNVDGQAHLRLVTLENWPHATSAHAPWLSWSFLRRFARDPQTGELIDLQCIR